MRITRKAAFAAVAATSVLALAACSSGGGSDDETDDAGINTETSINIAWNQPFYSANGNSITGNATANNVILYMLNSSFYYYDPDLNLVQDESFGTLREGLRRPAADQVHVRRHREVVRRHARPAPPTSSSSGPRRAASSTTSRRSTTKRATSRTRTPWTPVSTSTPPRPSMALVEETPEIDGNSITLTYTKPFADWATAISMNLPAHVVAQRALGIEDAEEATDALVAAIQDDNVEDLSPIAKSWSTDWNFASMPSDEDLLVTSGAYKISEFEQEQFITLTANPDYEGDHKAVFNKVTVRYNGDPMGQARRCRTVRSTSSTRRPRPTSRPPSKPWTASRSRAGPRARTSTSTCSSPTVVRSTRRPTVATPRRPRRSARRSSRRSRVSRSSRT